MSDSIFNAFKVFGRRKIAFQEANESRMSKSLFIIDITCLGLSTILGTGVFTILAHAAKNETGPSVVLSFLIAAVASCLGGLCYSELSSRFPEGGPSYVYIYSTLGEIWAFLIGWSMIFEYVIASALAAKSLTSYLNSVTNGTLVNLIKLETHTFHLLPGFEGDSLDLVSLLIIVSAGALIAFDLKLSCLINNILVFTCSLIIAGIVMIALSDMDPENWTAGAGFFPNGVNGIFSAASLCFFAFHGYDIIVSTAGETQHRIRIVPVGISLAFLLGLVACFSSSVAITLLIPYSLMDDHAPIIQAFVLRGLDGMKYLVVIGATSGLYAALIATFIGLSRLIFYMSSDGLLPETLSHYDNTKGTTKPAVIAACILSSLVALIVKSSTLFLWLGCGSLLSYMFVSVAILSLRYGLPNRLPLESSELIQRDSTFGDIDSPLDPNEGSHLAATTTLTASMTTLRSNQITEEASSTYNHQQSFSPDPALVPRSVSDCLLNHRTVKSTVTCDSRNCQLCMGRPMLKPNRTFIKGAKMYGTLDKPKTMAVDFFNDTFITSITNLESDSKLDGDMHDDLSVLSSSSSSSSLLLLSSASNHRNQYPTEKSAQQFSVLLSITMGLMLLMGALTVHVSKYLPHEADWWIELIVGGFFTLIVILVISIVRKPRHDPVSRNSIPCVPLLPICAIWMDIHLIVCLPSSSWLAFLIWSLIGIFVYMGYSVWHSHERDSNDSEDLQELNLSVSLDEDNDEIIHCLDDMIDGSSV